MKITKSGFYKLSEINGENIEIVNDLNVVFFDDGKKSRKIEIGENCRVDVYGFLDNIIESNLNIILNKKNTKLNLGYLLLSGNNNESKCRIYSKIRNNNSESNMNIISIVGNNGFVDFDGIIDIEEGISGVNGNLREENIFVGNKGKIVSIPSLFVKSNDVKASHSCKIERINDEKLFYLTSKGIKKEDALSMILESYVKTLFKCFYMIDNNFYANLVGEILTKIKDKKFIY